MLTPNSDKFRFYKRGVIRNQRHVSICLKKTKYTHKVDEKYLSFSIDISVLAGGYWWEGSQGTQRGLGTEKTTPLDLQQRKLNKLVNALGPAYLRVGGSEADNLHYFTPPPEQPNALVLTHEIWNNLHHFCQKNQLDLMFTFKYGLFRKSLHGSWQTDQVQKLLKYSNANQQKIAICELGNELNAYWAFHGLNSQPVASKLAKDYDTFIRVVRDLSPESKVAGPGSAFWPRLGETIKPFSNITPKFLAAIEEKLDIVDWHYYPFQSRRSPLKTRSATLKNLLSVRSFLDYEKYLSQLIRYRERFQPDAEIWTGETGSAQCGGEANLSDRFVSSFWWADQLGRGARLGQKVMIRQSLIGGDYALINKNTLKPNPDYWVSWLWNKLMGDCVFQVTSNDNQVLTYCHSAKKMGKCTLLIINMTPFPKRIHNQGFGIKKKRFEITANNLLDAEVRINGVKPKFNGGKIKLKDFPTLSKLDLVSPYSINFWCFSL